MRTKECGVNLSVVILLVLVASVAASGQIKIGELKDPVEVEGCSCTLQTAAEAGKPGSQKFLFVTEAGTKDAWMNINGKDVKLKLVKTTVIDDRNYGVGGRFYEEYTAQGMKIRIDYVVTWTCPPEDEECDHAKYDTTVTVTKGKMSETIKTIGICAC